MSMKFFTLSAVCVLVFCMLLALSGTADLSGQSELASSLSLTSSRPQLDEAGRASVHPRAPRISDWSETYSPLTSGMAIIREITQNRLIRLVGVLFLIGWIFLSFKLLSTD